MRQDASNVQVGGRMDRGMLILGRQDQQAEREGAQGNKGLLRFLPRIDAFQMLHDRQLRSVGIHRIDNDQVRTEIRLELCGEERVGHDDRRLRKRPAGVEFLTARLRNPRADYTENHVRVFQLLSGLRIEKNGRRLPCMCRRHVYREAIDSAEGLESQSSDLVSRTPV